MVAGVVEEGETQRTFGGLGGQWKVCKIVEDLIAEEMIELAKKAISRGRISLEDIAEMFNLPLPFVEKLARQKGV